MVVVRSENNKQSNVCHVETSKLVSVYCMQGQDVAKQKLLQQAPRLGKRMLISLRPCSSCQKPPSASHCCSLTLLLTHTAAHCCYSILLLLLLLLMLLLMLLQVGKFDSQYRLASPCAVGAQRRTAPQPNPSVNS